MIGGPPRSPTLRALLARAKPGRCFLCGGQLPEKRKTHRRQCARNECRQAYNAIRHTDRRAERERMGAAR